MAKNLNCMNVCLANELLTQVDKYAKKSGLRRDQAIEELIGIAEGNAIYTADTGQQYLTFRVPPGARIASVTWTKDT